MNAPHPAADPDAGQFSVRHYAARAALFLALVVVALLAAAAGDIGMEGAWLHPTPRVNSLTVGLGLVPVLAMAVGVYLWTAPRSTGAVAVGGRVLGTLLTVAVAGLALAVALFFALFVG